MIQRKQSTRALVAGAATMPGRDKTVNEDRFWIPDNVSSTNLARKGHLYIVADGVGGHKAGDVASQMAVDIIARQYYESPESDIALSLQHSLKIANAQIHAQAQRLEYDEMASTVVALVIRGQELIVAHVGDSRAYLWRQGQLQQLTQDHTWVAERIATGVLTSEEAAQHELRHVITRALGNEPTVKVDIHRYQFSNGDRLLLGCDGLWEPLSNVELSRSLHRYRPQKAAERLVQIAIQAGGGDDTTALVVSSAGTGQRDPLDFVRRRSGFIYGGILIGIVILAVMGLFSLSTPERIPPVEHCTDVVTNGGFENDNTWDFKRLVAYDSDQYHTGAQSVRIHPPVVGDPFSFVKQEIVIPKGTSARLSFWTKSIGPEASSEGADYYVFIYPESASEMQKVDSWRKIEGGWHRREINLTGYVGQKARLYFSVGYRSTEVPVLYIDDVELTVCP